MLHNINCVLLSLFPGSPIKIKHVTKLCHMKNLPKILQYFMDYSMVLLCCVFLYNTPPFETIDNTPNIGISYLFWWHLNGKRGRTLLVEWINSLLFVFWHLLFMSRGGIINDCKKNNDSMTAFSVGGCNSTSIFLFFYRRTV